MYHKTSSFGKKLFLVFTYRWTLVFLRGILILLMHFFGGGDCICLKLKSEDLLHGVAMSHGWAALDCCLPEKTRRDIIFKVRVQHKSYSTVAEELNISRGAVCRYVKIFNATQDVASPCELYCAATCKQRKRKKKLDYEPAKLLLKYNVQQDNMLFLREFKQMLFEKIGLSVGESTISRFWKDQKYSMKRICKMAVEASPYDEYLFFTVLNRITSRVDQLVWGDEAHCDLRDVSRYRGRSPMLSDILY